MMSVVREVVEVAAVVVGVVTLGVVLHRLNPDPPNPLRPTARGALAHNFWSNSWWAGAGAMLLAPVLTYLEGVTAGLAVFAVGAIVVAFTTWVLRD